MFPRHFIGRPPWITSRCGSPSPDWAILIPRAGPGPQFAITVSSDAADHKRHRLNLNAEDAKAELHACSVSARHVSTGAILKAPTTWFSPPDGNMFYVIEKHPA
jgi:hypothetical protein